MAVARAISCGIWGSTSATVRATFADAEGEEKGASEFPYGIEPAKLETLNIMRDYIQVLSGQPTTAKTTEKKE
jgi:carboxyl-terminal processing protease